MAESKQGCCTFIGFWHLLRFLTLACVVAIIVIQVLICIEIIDGTNGTDPDEVDKLSVVVSAIGTALIGLAVVCGLMEYSSVKDTLIANWIGLGLVTVYIAMLSLRSLFCVFARDKEGERLFVEIASWSAAGFGAVYFVLGLLGGRSYKDRKQRRAK